MELQSDDRVQVGKLECIADYACETGENPLWRSIDQRIYWSDIPTGRLFRYEPSTGDHDQCYSGRPVRGFTMQTDRTFLLFLNRGTIATWDGRLLTEVVHEIPCELDSRFNDVIADPAGRVFCGTMSTPDAKGRLYRLDLDGSLHMLSREIGCTNGMAFSLDRKKFYYTDSFAREIYLFDYDISDGSIRNQRVFARFNLEDGLPDGCTLDAEGRLWTALWDGGCIARLTSDGRIDQRVALPVPKVSSLTFGGADYRDLYITTAGGSEKAVEGSSAGALFRLQAAGQGIPEFLSRIRIASTESADQTTNTCKEES